MKKFKVFAMAIVFLMITVVSSFAYTATITKQSVVKQGNFYRITLNVTINDEVSDVLDFQVTAKYSPNAPNMDAIKADLRQQMLAKWDEYKANNQVFTHPALDTVVSDLQTQANFYINQ